MIHKLQSNSLFPLQPSVHLASNRIYYYKICSIHSLTRRKKTHTNRTLPNTAFNCAQETHTASTRVVSWMIIIFASRVDIDRMAKQQTLSLRSQHSLTSQRIESNRFFLFMIFFSRSIVIMSCHKPWSNINTNTNRCRTQFRMPKMSAADYYYYCCCCRVLALWCHSRFAGMFHRRTAKCPNLCIASGVCGVHACGCCPHGLAQSRTARYWSGGGVQVWGMTHRSTSHLFYYWIEYDIIP